MAKRDAHLQEGGKVLTFLDHHRLSHTPDHYSFAHEYLNGEDQDLRAKVDDVIDGGIRLTSEQVADTSNPQTCVALVDVDGLRRINKAHSIEVGDRLLKIVARDLIDLCPGHTVARCDGGTFAVLATNLDLRSAGRMMARACEAFSARDMRVRDSNKPLGHVTLSVGIVAVRGRGAGAVLAAANDQLQRAKQGGRNQVALEGIVISVSDAVTDRGKKAT